MQNLIIQENIGNLIYNIRGKEVMLDSDHARLYHCTNGTKDINKAVKRNIDKFPNDFYFQLSEEEYYFLRFQNGTSKKESRGGRQYKNVTFINNDSFHDRFIIVDRSIIYAIGASLKDIGKKCFHIPRISEKQILDGILSRIFKE